MNNVFIPSILNFVLPGAGLLWVGRNIDAFINLLIAVIAPLLWFGMIGPDSIHYAFLAVAAGSAGYAHAVATRMRQEA